MKSKIVPTFSALVTLILLMLQLVALHFARLSRILNFSKCFLMFARRAEEYFPQPKASPFWSCGSRKHIGMQCLFLFRKHTTKQCSNPTSLDIAHIWTIFIFIFPLKILASSPKKFRQWGLINWLHTKCSTYIKKEVHTNLPALSFSICVQRGAVPRHTTSPASR